MARLYTNENFPLPIALELRRLGHDVLTWLAVIANVAGVFLIEAVLRKYRTGCPVCEHLV